jgi:hypothetical protein
MSGTMSVAELSALGRVRLSHHFFMREMLYSEVANVHGVPNIPDDPMLAVEAGRHLCERILEPLRAAFGHVSIRSAYRSGRCNGRCHELYKAGDRDCWCLDNDYNAARHIWDRRDGDGYLGATATIVLPLYLDYYDRTGDWRSLAWWLFDHVEFAELMMFGDLCAFNIRWYEGPNDKSVSFADHDHVEILTWAAGDNAAGSHAALYADAVSAGALPAG